MAREHKHLGFHAQKSFPERSALQFRGRDLETISERQKKSLGGDIYFSWPSGRGVEIGTLDLGLPEAWDVIVSHGGDSLQDFRMVSVQDDGAESVILSDFDGAPICLTSEPELPDAPVGVIVDVGAEIGAVREFLAPLLGKHVTFHE